uniref:Uncharacterized protein n=1 Tax=Globodera rostochiensis TaxID=31243 RepID=A0A914GS81_GLORO
MNRQQPLWICNKTKKHGGKQPTKGFYVGRFFEGAHISPNQIFAFTTTGAVEPEHQDLAPTDLYFSHICDF